MNWRDWVIAGAVVTFVGSQTVPAYIDPFEPKKDHHTHLETYEPVRTTDNIVMPFLLTGTRITPGTGTLTLEGGQSLVV